MKFEYTGRHIEVTPALRSHVESHFEKLNHLFDGDGAKAHVIIEVEKGRHRSEIVINWRKEVLTANTTEADMYQSLSRTIDKIGKQALRLKSKITDKHHKAKKVTTVESADNEIVPMPDAPQIIETKRYSVKPMTDEEAALKLNSDVNQFLVFRNAESDRISVIYKKQDGNYGLIQP
jgi:putative sigma-54 modulation protein